MRLLFRFVPLIIFIPMGIYIYFFFNRFLTIFGLQKKRILSRLLSVLVAALCILCSLRIYDIGAVVVLHFVVLSVLMDIINVIVKHCAKRKSAEKSPHSAGDNTQQSPALRRWGFVYRSGIVCFAALALIMTYGYINIHQVHRTAYNITTQKVLEGDLKIVQISDLHFGTTMDAEILEKYCQDISAENPDILVLTGDIFDESTSRELMEKGAALLGGISSKYGIYYVFGNHDYNYYVETPNYLPGELRTTLKDAGITVLEDEYVQVNDTLTIIGRQDASVSRMALADIISGVNKNTFLLLLDHQPAGEKENEALGIDLQLSGHTHAGQIWPTGLLGVLTGINEQNYGWEQHGSYQRIVSSGIGGWGYAIRTGGHSEYVVITVTSQK